MRNKRNSSYYTTLTISMIVLSFAPFGLIFLVPYLPLSAAQKAICVTGLVISAEVIQWIAILIVGKQIFNKFKRHLNPIRWFGSKSNKTELVGDKDEQHELILVFKTSIKSEEEANIIRPHLDRLVQQSQWNFDLEKYYV